MDFDDGGWLVPFVGRKGNVCASPSTSFVPFARGE